MIRKGYKWMLRPNLDLLIFLNEAEKEGKEIRLIRSFTDDRGLELLEIGICLESEKVFKKFRERVKSQIVMTDWYSMTPKDYSVGSSFSSIMNSNSTRSWFDGLMIAGMNNEIRLDQLEYEHKEGSYYSTDWLINTRQTYLLADAHAISVELDCLLYKLGSQQSKDGYHIETIGIRVPDNLTLTVFTKRIGKQAGLDKWKQISPTVFFETGSKFSGVFGTEAFIEINLKLSELNDRKSKEL